MKTRPTPYYIARPLNVPDTPETRRAAQLSNFQQALKIFRECAKETGHSYMVYRPVYASDGELIKYIPGPEIHP